VELTLDSGTGLAELEETLRLRSLSSRSVTAQSRWNLYEQQYEQQKKTDPQGAVWFMPTLVQIAHDRGDIGDWYLYQRGPYFLRPLRLAE
jgi:hypothetical protein